MSDRKLIVVGDHPPYTGIGPAAGARIREVLGCEPATSDAEVANALSEIHALAARVRDALELAPGAAAGDVESAIAALHERCGNAEDTSAAMQNLSAQREQTFAEQQGIWAVREFAALATVRIGGTLDEAIEAIGLATEVSHALAQLPTTPERAEPVAPQPHPIFSTGGPTR